MASESTEFVTNIKENYDSTYSCIPLFPKTAYHKIDLYWNFISIV